MGDTEKIATTNGLRLTRLAAEQTQTAFLLVGVPEFSLTLARLNTERRVPLGPRVHVRGRCFLRVAMGSYGDFFMGTHRFRLARRCIGA